MSSPIIHSYDFVGAGELSVEVRHHLLGEDLVRPHRVLEVGPVAAVEQIGPEAARLVDESLDLLDRPVGGADHHRPTVVRGVDALVEAHLVGSRHRQHVREVVGDLLVAVTEVLARLGLGVGEVHRAEQPPVAAVDDLAVLGRLGLGDLPVVASRSNPSGDVALIESNPMPCLPASFGPAGENDPATVISMCG